MYRSYPLAAVRQKERFDYFLSLVDEVFCPMHCEPAGGAERFYGRLEASNLGSVRLARVTTSPIAVSRRLPDIARIQDPPYLVKFQLRGQARWSQRGREVSLGPGDFVIASTAEPYRLDLITPYEMMVLAVPGADMQRLSMDPEHFLGRRMPAEDASCGLVSSFVAELVPRMSRLPRSMAERVQTNMLDLLSGVLDAHARRPVARSRDAQLRSVKRFIAHNLHSRELGPKMIAAAFGVSARYVHKLFATGDVTLARYIKAERLRECRSALADPGFSGMSITDIALQWGFYDLSHMTRGFREAYGMCPSQYRRQAAAA